MTVQEAGGRAVPVQFAGTRTELFGLLVRGYVLMLPTLGLYRFWLTTWKRRFYWQSTLIDGDSLEYSGHALQLLIGFLFAVFVFLPIYLVLFYLSTQVGELVVLGYLSVAGLLWFLGGYAIFRARDFRLSRTLWRGIRFAQKGSAWNYALRRFGWSLLMLPTLGLAYPFMMASLWRYRYRHTWYGDRQFQWVGSWKTIAGPFYLAYGAVLLAVIGSAAILAITAGPGELEPTAAALVVAFVLPVALALAWCYFRSREATRMFSAVRLGSAALAVRVRARSLVGQALLYLLSLLGILMVFALLAGFVFGAVAGQLLAGPGGAAELGRLLQSSWLAVTGLVAGYLALLAAFALAGELFLGFGFWALVARNAVVSDVDSLRSVRAADDDPALIGEGLADALNVGAY